MTRREQTEQPGIWLGPILAWAALLTLLALNVVLAGLPLGVFKLPANLAVAALQAIVMGLVFMRLNRASWLVRLCAVSAFLWISLMFILAFADTLTRV
ncbi:oxidase [Caulobacter sp. S45]|uniref:oxidase n=1 Tax=Caulobacter sp. S45 TaxID=1641861 RepID=UPI00131D5B2F|nr:oxidase [Caulobacter sp. S45]